MSAAVQRETNIKYQSHIDGMRALAIILVLLFHFELGGVTNGYLGVDIFFVISGYLVGGHILNALASDRLNLIEFYARRIGRILPALLIVAWVTVIAGYFILLPEDYSRLAKSIRASMLLTANQHFSNAQDYFGPGKYDTYFLHSWSLSIEEQFYLFFPFVALVASRFLSKTWLPFALFILILLSACWQWILGQQGQLGAFYNLTARSWELLVGVLAAACQSRDYPAWANHRALPWLGLSMCLGPVVLPKADAFELAFGLQCLTVGGTALLLLSCNQNSQSQPTKLLSHQSIRPIGLISYSLYLVHWPLLTLAGYWHIAPLDAAQRIMLLGLSFLFAYASWRFAENPIRKRAYANSQRSHLIFLPAFAATIFTIWACSYVLYSNGFPQRMPAAALAKVKAKSDFSPLRKKCHSNVTFAPIPLDQSCKLGADGATAKYAIWSDSHGAEIAFEMGKKFEQDNAALIQLSNSGCPPLLGVQPNKVEGCRKRNDAVMDWLKRKPSIGIVILVWHQNAYLDVPEAERLSGLRRTLSALKRAGKHAVLVGPIPLPEYNVPSAMAITSWQPRPNIRFSQSRNRFEEVSGRMALQSRRIVSATGADYYDPAELLCDSVSCRYVQNGTALYFDNNHPSLAAARKFATVLTPAYLDALVRPNVR